MLGIRLDPALEARLERLARESGQTKSDLTREAIRQYLDRQGPRRVPDDQLVAYLMALGARHAARPLIDDASEDEIPGYDEMEGLTARPHGD